MKTKELAFAVCKPVLCLIILYKAADIWGKGSEVELLSAEGETLCCLILTSDGEILPDEASVGAREVHFSKLHVTHPHWPGV